MSLHERMRQVRDAELAKMDAILAPAEAEKRELRASEQRAFDAISKRVHEMDARVAELGAVEASNAECARALAPFSRPGTPGLGFGSEPVTYRKGDQRPEASFVRDFVHASRGDMDARERLIRNEHEVNAYQESRAGVTTVAGAGGEFAPPLWSVADFVNLPRAGRAFANIVTQKELPAGVSSINLPTVSAGTTVAAQATQNTAISNTDPTTSSIAIAIKTIAGYNLVSQQELDQSPVNMDDVLLGDLAAAYNAVLDTAVIAAVAGWSAIIGQTYTDASPTTPKVNTQLADMIQKIATQRFADATAVVMTPRRWANFLSYTDTAGRPLITPAAVPGSFNAWGTQDGVTSQKVVGSLQGLPVITDPNIPVNLGGGTNQDEVFVVKADDLVLYESVPRMVRRPVRTATNCPF